ncbi:GtrA family protein [Synechococcus sp. Tobar12-5m-g]|uniref:GtrA family protein n=1 Tax=Synechococcus sp. Tobar12-5m-g TaxID=2823742 RepID=UPI0020CFC50E|nr:GtrA family protein [Synechococcus sp. Tobar12-5m-g]MCP9873288.1 GtrA family protein [Synechococcus sp. Cruz CV-v-12]
MNDALESSLVRFLLVGGFGEALYLALYGLVWRASGRVTTAIAIAGGICLVLNAVLHARISFRVRFHPALLLRYTMIQLLCLLLSLLAGWGLERFGTNAWAVAMLTLVIWSGTSFLLTRHSFRPQPPEATAGLASRHTSSSRR